MKIEDEEDAGFSPAIGPFDSMSPEAKKWLEEDMHLEQPVTEVQKVFWKAMTVQRTANLMAAADFHQRLSPEAKKWLLKADEDKITQLNSTLEFYSTSKTIWKFLLVGSGLIVTAFTGFSVVWKVLGEYVTVKLK